MYWLRRIIRQGFTTGFLVVLLAATAWAKPQITVSLGASKEVIETANGRKVVRLVPASDAASGDVLYFTLTYTNRGTEPAFNAVIDNPLPREMTYIDNSATGKNAETTFSIDGGKTFKKPSLLTYEVPLPGGGQERHTARPEEYTHIRWVIRTIPAGASGEVGFKARVR